MPEDTELRERPGDQPLPVPNGRPSIQSLVRADLDAREQLGVQRYGTALQAHNGRDMLRDAYDEAMDLTTYLRGVIEERDTSRAICGDCKTGHENGPCVEGSTEDTAPRYRLGHKNPRNLYAVGPDGETHVGCVFEEEFGPVVVAALNARPAPAPVVGDLRNRVAVAIGEANERAEENADPAAYASLSYATYREMADAALSVVGPELAAKDREIERLARALTRTVQRRDDDRAERGRLDRELDERRDLLDEVVEHLFPVVGGDWIGKPHPGELARGAAHLIRMAASPSPVEAQPSHLTVTTSDRGFDAMPPIPSAYGGEVLCTTLPGDRECPGRPGVECAGCTTPAEPPVQAEPSDTTEQWGVWYGGGDPNDAAGLAIHDSEDEAFEALQWYRSDQGAGVAVRDFEFTAWRIVRSIPANAEPPTAVQAEPRRDSLSDNDIRRRLLEEHGPCTCTPGDCPEEDNECGACSAMDIYWQCFRDPVHPWPPAEVVEQAPAAQCVFSPTCVGGCQTGTCKVAQFPLIDTPMCNATVRASGYCDNGHRPDPNRISHHHVEQAPARQDAE